MKKFLSFLLSALFCVATAFGLTSCGNKTDAKKDLANVQEKGVIKIGMECAYAPYNWSVSASNDYTARVVNGRVYGGDRARRNFVRR